jgi:Fe-S cluster assembly protein SufD
MTAPTKTLRTPAEAEIIERFSKARDALPGKGGIRAARTDAFSKFENAGLPHRRIEEWKYSDLRARLKTAAPLASKPEAKAAAAALKAANDSFDSVDRYRLVLVDGFFMPELSDRDGMLKDGIEVAGLSELLAGNDKEAAGLLSVPEIAADDIAVALNTAFIADGVTIYIAKGSRPSKPIEICHVATGKAPAAIYVRNRVVAGDDVQASIIETSLGGTDGSEINLVTDLQIGANSQFTVARLQDTAIGATNLSSSLVHLGKNVELKHLSAEAGAGFSRNQTFLTFAGEHSTARILGVSMLHGTRHIDQTLVVDHAVPHCASRELFKTVADDRSSGVFQGKIMVRQDAQKTDGKMMSQALLLSEEAEMAAKPELEIFADDVVCGHGATSGQIDKTMLFYLMARGIPRPEAERLLIEAFLDDAVDAIENETIAEALKGTISRWLNGRNASRGAKAA